MMQETKRYRSSMTVWLSLLTHLVLAGVTYTVAWSQTDDPFSWRGLIGVLGGGLLAAWVPVLGGRRRGGLPLGWAGRPRRRRRRPIALPGRCLGPLMVVGLLGAALAAGGVFVSCGSGLSATSAVGPLASGAIAGLQCPGVDVQVKSDFSRPQDLVSLEDALQVLSEIGRDGQAQRARDVVRVLLKCPPPGPWLEVYLEFGVVAGRSLPLPDS